MLIPLHAAPARRRPLISCALLAALVATHAGCSSLTGPPKETAASDAVGPKQVQAGYRDPSEEKSDEWIEEAGQQARGNRPRTKDPDGWWGKYIISEQHRSIEKNLGIDYD